MDKTVVAIHSTDLITRAGLSALLGDHPAISLVNWQDRLRADVLIVVAETVSESAMDLLWQLRAEVDGKSGVNFLLVTDAFPSAYLQVMLDLGVVGVLSRHGAVEDLVDAILGSRQGFAYLPPELQGSLVSQVERIRIDILEPNKLTLSGLAMREVEILRLASQGLETSEIATTLRYSERTVKNIFHGVMVKHHLKNRAHAVAFAVRSGAI